MRIKLIVFDLDGTLLDTREFLYQGFEYALSVHKLPPKTREELAHIISVTKYLPEAYALLGITEDVDKIIQTQLTFRSQHIDLVTVYPHVLETLSIFKQSGIIIAALTNRLKQLHETLEVTMVNQYLDLLITKNDVIHPKPHPEGVEKILKHFSITKSNAVIVGDTSDDIQTGINAGVKTVGVTYGFGAYAIKKSKPDFIINTFPELLKILSI